MTHTQRCCSWTPAHLTICDDSLLLKGRELRAGVNLDTLRPEPSVEGYSTPGGYSSKAVKPIALAKCMSIAKVIDEEFGGLQGGRSLSGIGGVERGADAAEFILLGASTVQVRFLLHLVYLSVWHSACSQSRAGTCMNVHV